MKILQSRSFKRKVKKLTKLPTNKFNEDVRKIINKPSIGSEKKGDLRGVYLHKLKIQAVQYLLAYRFLGNNLELIMIGPHENHYWDLKSYLKGR
ncbi:type II toxin-antitoxin system RelE/ParE family toxin [Thermodesulfobacteriota bacterium]